jgi:hypothetical protein
LRILIFCFQSVGKFYQSTEKTGCRSLVASSPIFHFIENKNQGRSVNSSPGPCPG